MKTQKDFIALLFIVLSGILSSALVFIAVVPLAWKLLKRREAIYAMLSHMTSQTLFKKMEIIQKFYSIIFERQMYTNDKKVKESMNPTAVLTSEKVKDKISKRMSFNKAVDIDFSNVKDDPKDNELSASKKINTITNWRRFMLSVGELKLVVFILTLFASFFIFLIVISNKYSQISTIANQISFMRFTIIEYNVYPRLFGPDTTDERYQSLLEELTQDRSEILKTIYMITSNLEVQNDLFFSRFTNETLRILNENTTSIFFSDNKFAQNLYLNKFTIEYFNGTSIYSKILSKAFEFASTFNSKMSDIIPVTNKGLKFAILTNMNICDFILKFKTEKNIEQRNEFQDYIEHFNNRLLIFIYFAFESISAFFYEDLKSLAVTFICLWFIMIFVTAVCLLTFGVRFYKFISTKLQEKLYIENNIINLIDSDSLNRTEELFKNLFSDINFYKLTF
jgi:hypothetical protein